MREWLFLSAAIGGEILGTSALKASAGFSRPGASILVVVGYACAFYCLSVALRTIPMGVAYAIWSGVGVVAISLVGLLVYKQRLDVPTIFGLALILAGTLVINLWSRNGAA